MPPLPAHLVLPVEELGVALAGDRPLLPGGLPDRGEAVVERRRPLDSEVAPAAVEPLAREDRQERVERDPPHAGRDPAAAVLLDQDPAPQHLDVAREPAEVLVADAPRDRLRVLVRIAEGAGEPVLAERVHRRPLERHRRPEPAVPVVARRTPPRPPPARARRRPAAASGRSPTCRRTSPSARREPGRSAGGPSGLSSKYLAKRASRSPCTAGGRLR